MASDLFDSIINEVNGPIPGGQYTFAIIRVMPDQDHRLPRTKRICDRDFVVSCIEVTGKFGRRSFYEHFNIFDFNPRWRIEAREKFKTFCSAIGVTNPTRIDDILHKQFIGTVEPCSLKSCTVNLMSNFEPIS